MTGLQVWLHPSSRTVKQSSVTGRRSLAESLEPDMVPHWRQVQLDAASLRRPAPVVRDRRKVLDRADFDAGSGQRTDRRLASRPRATNTDIDRTHTVIARHVGGVHCGLL